METINEIIDSLKELEKRNQENEEKGVSCAVAMSEDCEIKVAVIKTEKPRVYEILQFEKIDDVLFKERITKRVQIYGRKNAASIVMKIINKEVRLWRINQKL